LAGAKVTLTDQPAGLPILKANVELNSEKQTFDADHIPSVEKLVW